MVNKLFSCLVSIHKKSVKPAFSLVSRVEAFALPSLSKRATPKAPRRCMLIPIQEYKYTTRGVPAALFLTDCLKLRSSNASKPKRKGTPFLCICRSSHLHLRAFSKTLTLQSYYSFTLLQRIILDFSHFSMLFATFHHIFPTT